MFGGQKLLIGNALHLHKVLYVALLYRYIFYAKYIEVGRQKWTAPKNIYKKEKSSKIWQQMIARSIFVEC